MKLEAGLAEAASSFCLFHRMSSVTQLFAREMSCGGQMRDLPALIEFIETACDDAAVQPELRFDLTLAVEEACSNVIEHAYKGNGGELVIRFELRDRDRDHHDLHDHGRPFNPGKVGRPDTSIPLEERPLGGLGLHLMHQLMDEVRYEVLPDGNRLTMIKRDVSVSSGKVAGAGRPTARQLAARPPVLSVTPSWRPWRRSAARSSRRKWTRTSCAS